MLLLAASPTPLVEPLRPPRTADRSPRHVRPHGPATVLALLASAALLLPSVLPRDPMVQAVLLVVVALSTYGLTRLVAAGGERVRGQRAAPWPTAARCVLGALTAAVLVIAAVVGLLGQRVLADVVRVTPPDGWTQAVSVLGALGVARAILALFDRVRRTRVRRGVAAVVLVALTLSSGVLLTRFAGVDPHVKGHQFLASTPRAEDIGAVTGRPARTPVRVYVGLDDAPTARARADLAVRELRRTGALTRSLLVVAIPTGTGWVNPSSAAAVEYLHDGDTAIVVQQYAAASSFLAYVQGTDAASDSARDLLDAVGRELRVRRRAGLPVPTLVVTGESLGAIGGLTALAGRGDVHGLWVGVPAQVHDRVGQGQTTLVHDTDPVAAWSPGLLWRPTPTWPHPWVPLVSFVQATGDLVGAARTPFGYGHKYSREYLAGWERVVPGPTPLPGAVRARVEAVLDAVR
ncbi:alpha/beta-hydrolase family protein [Kineococcus gynurae]|uniref:Alpha/beta-hydrolase family protein n=1 Tax=Kineococcus gynurae TaxID=452979 RepID=A0ABV5LSH9_9ACTN